MLELKLIAAGSSPLIAEEIKSVAQSFLGEEIFIDTATTDEIETPPELKRHREFYQRLSVFLLEGYVDAQASRKRGKQ